MKKKLLVLLLSVSLIFACTFALAACGEESPNAKPSDGLEFELSDDGSYYKVSIKDMFSNRNVVIPDTYNGLPVGAINDYGFAFFYDLTTITIPDSVTYIGNRAFSNCDGLKSITIPDSVTYIGSSAFEGCTGLTSIIIPDGVTEIGNGTFWFCDGLTSITIPASVTEIGLAALQECSALTSITYKGTMQQWETIRKSSGWNEETGEYTVHCLDGDIYK